RRAGDHAAGEDLGAVVLVPGDGVVAVGGGQDVEVAVAVQVRHQHALRVVDHALGGHVVFGEVAGAVTLIPDDLVTDAQAGDHVHVAVAGEVGGVDGLGRVRRRVHEAHAGEAVGGARAGQDGDLVVLDLAVRGRAAHAQAAGGAQPEARVGHPGR